MKMEPSWWVNTLIRRDMREISPSLSDVWGYTKITGLCKPGGELLSETELADTLVLDFPASMTARKKVLVFKTPNQSIVFCYGSVSWLRHTQYSETHSMLSFLFFNSITVSSSTWIQTYIHATSISWATTMWLIRGLAFNIQILEQWY